MSWAFWYLVLTFGGNSAVVVPIPYDSEQDCVQAWEDKKQDYPGYVMMVCVPSNKSPYANGGAQ